jgi:hypothetical protein
MLHGGGHNIVVTLAANTLRAVAERVSGAMADAKVSALLHARTHGASARPPFLSGALDTALCLAHRPPRMRISRQDRCLC